MKKMSKIVSLTMAAALAAASLSMSACADGEEKIEIAVTGGGEDSMQLNTATSGYLNGISALRHLYEGLYKLDANGEIVLGQAASAETSEDKLTWTFTLRDDITWSDGQPVTAGDFVFGFDNLAAQGGEDSGDQAETALWLSSLHSGFPAHLSGKTGLCGKIWRSLCDRSGQGCL